MRTLEFNKYTGSYFFYNEEEDVRELTKPIDGDVIKMNDDFSYNWIYGSKKEWFNKIMTSIYNEEGTRINNYTAYTSSSQSQYLDEAVLQSSRNEYIWELQPAPRYTDDRSMVSALAMTATQGDSATNPSFNTEEINEMNRLYEQELNNEG